MVSKIAVIALVAIVAAPILLGYGLNFESSDSVRFTPDNTETSITELIQNTNQYDYVDADIVAMNGDQIRIDDHVMSTGEGHPYGYWYIGRQYIPQYEERSAAYSPIAWRINTFTNTVPSPTPLTVVKKMYMDIMYDTYPVTSSNGVTLTFYDGNGVSMGSVSRALYLYWDGSTAWHAYINSSNKVVTGNLANPASVAYTAGPTFSGQLVNQFQFSTDDSAALSTGSAYIDFSKGFRTFPVLSRVAPMEIQYNPYYLRPLLVPPTPASSITMSIDLESVSEPDYTFRLEPYANATTTTWPTTTESIVFNKTTVGSDVTWLFQRFAAGETTPSYSEIIPYDPAGSNTYQLRITPTAATLYYVGGWPANIGPANYFRTWQTDLNVGGDIAKIALTSNTPTAYVQSPVIRVDAASVRASQHPIIQNKIFFPGEIKTSNPVVTLKNITQYGTDIQFGYRSFAVTDGSITLDGHKIPLQGAKFDTIFEDGVYEYRINGTPINTGPGISGMYLGGSWSANVTVDSQTATTYTQEKWVPGKFAWQGVDDSFKTVGLLASLGAFVFIGMYGRKSGAKVLPLLLICGGAALMFLVMI